MKLSSNQWDETQSPHAVSMKEVTLVMCLLASRLGYGTPFTKRDCLAELLVLCVSLLRRHTRWVLPHSVSLDAELGAVMVDSNPGESRVLFSGSMDVAGRHWRKDKGHAQRLQAIPLFPFLLPLL